MMGAAEQIFDGRYAHIKDDDDGAPPKGASSSKPQAIANVGGSKSKAKVGAVDSGYIFAFMAD